MGSCASKDKTVIINKKAPNSNEKSVELFAEICASWGFDEKKAQINNLLVKALLDQGFLVNNHFEKKNGGMGEYFVFKVEQGKKKIVFSNNKSLHEAEGAIISLRISPNNLEAIVKKITN